MNFSETLATLSNASAFDLYRLRAAIERVLDQPQWIDTIRARLQVGQRIEYFDPRANRSEAGEILELRKRQALIVDCASGAHWLISYVAINLDGADVGIREKPRQGLGRNEMAVGDLVGFLDRDQGQRSGRVIRLNDKTVTLDCKGQQWRVAYSLLHRVVEFSAEDAGTLELEVLNAFVCEEGHPGE
jgi:hypothetical protein